MVSHTTRLVCYAIQMPPIYLSSKTWCSSVLPPIARANGWHARGARPAQPRLPGFRSLHGEGRWSCGAGRLLGVLCEQNSGRDGVGAGQQYRGGGGGGGEARATLEPVHADHGGGWADGRVRRRGHLQEASATEEGGIEVDADTDADFAATAAGATAPSHSEAVDALARAAHLPAAVRSPQAAERAHSRARHADAAAAALV